MWLNKDNSPPEIFNRRLLFAVIVYGLLGAAGGYDEGNISASTNQPSFRTLFKLDDETKSDSYLADRLSNITSMVQIGCVAGSIISFFIVDIIGRLRSLQLLCVLWIVGVVIQITSNDIGQLYAGRFIAGLGIGQTPVVGPTYLSEISPKNIRGLCTCVYSGSVYLGIMLGYFANYGAISHISDTNRNQWVIPTSVHIILGGVLLCGSFFIFESPRWLIKVGKQEKAIHNMSVIRRLPKGDPYIQSEIGDIVNQLEKEREELKDSSIITLIKELFCLKSNRYRIFLGIFSQLLSQWSGPNAVTIYAPTFFKMVGLTGTKNKLLMTAILGVVKFVSSLCCAFFLIDLIGRRKSLYCGISLQFIAILYLCIYLAVVPNAADTGAQTLSEKHAGKGALVMIYLSGCGWALGWNSIQYLINSEMFPLRVRSTACSIVMCIHYVNQFGNTKAVPTMLLEMHKWGALLFFAVITAIGLVWVWFFLPELSGRSLESMEDIFNLPWYLVGRKGNKLCPDVSAVNKIGRDNEYADEKGEIVNIKEEDHSDHKDES